MGIQNSKSENMIVENDKISKCFDLVSGSDLDYKPNDPEFDSFFALIPKSFLNAQVCTGIFNPGNNESCSAYATKNLALETINQNFVTEGEAMDACQKIDNCYGYTYNKYRVDGLYSYRVAFYTKNALDSVATRRYGPETSPGSFTLGIFRKKNMKC